MLGRRERSYMDSVKELKETKERTMENIRRRHNELEEAMNNLLFADDVDRTHEENRRNLEEIDKMLNELLEER